MSPTTRIKSKRLSIAFLLLTWLLGAAAEGAPTIWSGATNATWSNGANWSSGVPGVADEAIFNIAGPPFQPTVTTTTTISGLTFNAAPTITVNGGQTLNVTGVVAGTAGATFAGSGTTILTGTASTANGNLQIDSGILRYNVAAANTGIGSANIVINGGTFSFQGPELNINTTTGLPSTIADRSITNNLQVTSAGGTLNMNQGSGNNGQAVVFGNLNLGGMLTFTSSNGGNGEGYTVAGTLTIDQSAAGIRRITNNTSHNGSDWIAGQIVDGPGAAGNALRLAATGKTLQIASGTNTYAGGTIIESSGTSQGLIIARSTGLLGTGNLSVQAGGRVRLDNPTALAVSGNLLAGRTIDASAGGAVGVGANVNIADRFTGASAGIYGIDGGTAHSYALDMSTLGNGQMFLGTLTGGTYSGTSLTAGAGNTYRLGGGTGAASGLQNLLLTSNNVLTGTNNLVVGPTAVGGANLSRTFITADQNFTGNGSGNAVTISPTGFLVTTVNGGTPWGNTANVIDVYGTLAASSTAASQGVFNHAYTINLMPGGRIVLNNDGFVNSTGRGNGDRWGDTQAVSLNRATFRLEGARSAAITEQIGQIDFAGTSAISLSRNGTGGSLTRLVTGAPLVRVDRGGLQIDSAGFNAASNAEEFGFVTDAHAPANDATGLAPVYITQTSLSGSPVQYNWVSYNTATDRFEVLTPTVVPDLATFNTMGTANNVGLSSVTVSGVTTRTINSLRLSTGSGSTQTLTIGLDQTLTIGSGGLIMSGNGAYTIAGTTGAGTQGTLAFAGVEGVIWTNNSPTISARITGTNGLTKNGAGVLALTSANNDLAGPITVNNGTLRIGGGNGFTHNNDLRVASDATFDLRVNQTLGALEGHGTVTNAGATPQLLTLNSTADATFHGVIAGDANLALTKIGAGTQTLAGDNTYTGLTNINAGALRISGSLAGDVDVNNGGTLLGGGSIAGHVDIHDGGAFSPGNSPGPQTVGSETWHGGGTYVFEVNDFNGVAGFHPGWDNLTVQSLLNVAANTVNPFTIDVVSLDLANNAGLAANFDPTQNYELQIATTGGVTGFDPLAFVIDDGNFQNSLAGGQFSLERRGNDLYLLFQVANAAAVPEPASLALWSILSAVLAVGSVGLRRRSRRTLRRRTLRRRA